MLRWIVLRYIGLRNVKSDVIKTRKKLPNIRNEHDNREIMDFKTQHIISNIFFQQMQNKKK